MKSNQYSLKIASDRVQSAYDDGMKDLQGNLGSLNDQFNDDLQCFLSWMLERYAGKKVLITVQLSKK